MNVLILFVENKGDSIPYWDIVMTLCGGKSKKELANTSCKSMVNHALSALRKKGILYKKRRGGEVRYYLTRDGRRLIDSLQWN